jgi:quinol monooxygenase YgiN
MGETVMVLATVRMLIPSEKRREAFEILRMMAERTRVQLGCLSCRIYHDEQVEAVLMVEEVWRSQEDLDRHLRSDDYRHVLFVTEMAVEPPEIRFQTISHSAGIEIIEKARGCTRE